MINVVYIIDLAMQTPTGVKAQDTCFFGALDEVKQDLQKGIDECTRNIILHVADDIELASNEIKKNLLEAILKHDMNSVPVYPLFGSSQFNNMHRGFRFQGRVKVSKRLNDDTIDTKIN